MGDSPYIAIWIDMHTRNKMRKKQHYATYSVYSYYKQYERIRDLNVSLWPVKGALKLENSVYFQLIILVLFHLKGYICQGHK